MLPSAMAKNLRQNEELAKLKTRSQILTTLKMTDTLLKDVLKETTQN